jgi:hypothetical protein
LAARLRFPIARVMIRRALDRLFVEGQRVIDVGRRRQSP